MSNNYESYKFLTKERIEDRHAAAKAHRLARAAGSDRKSRSPVKQMFRLVGRFVVQMMNTPAKVVRRPDPARDLLG